MVKLSILLPTRNRPINIERFTRSVFSTATCPENVEILWYVDEDDHVSLPKLEELKQKFHNLHWVVGPRIPLGQTVNRLYPIARSDVWGLFGDDVVLETAGWDWLILNHFDSCTDKITLAFPRDFINNERFACHMFLHRRFVETLGYLTNPIYSARFLDTNNGEIMQNIAKATEDPSRFKYFGEIQARHLHYCNGTAPIDQVMVENNKRDEQMGSVWYSSLHERIRDCKKLLNYINLVGGSDFKLTNYERIL